MKFLIACLVIYGTGLSPWLYLLALVIQLPEWIHGMKMSRPDKPEWLRDLG